MIISASRRTDIPFHYPRWLMNRIRAGSCAVPNPFNPRQVSEIPLTPAAVDAIVFWTRYPEPLRPSLRELDARGFPHVFLVTVVDYPRDLEPGAPPLERRLTAFRRLADDIGPERVVWRYDPIVFSTVTGPDHHRQAFERIAGALGGHTRRCIVSILDVYRKVARRMAPLAGRGVRIIDPPEAELSRLMADIAGIASAAGITVTSCAEEIDLSPHGIFPGRCIDADQLAETFGIPMAHRKDPAQRKTCGCSVSRDIGMYDTCPAGCRYCYAVGDPERAAARHRAHDPEGEALWGGG